MSKKEQARAWLKSVVSAHLAANARNYKFTVVANEVAVSNALGLQIDIKPAEGKVVGESDEWLLIKTGRSEFMVAEKAILKTIPGIGSTVRITPYHRRRFDGKLVGAPEESVSGTGLRCQSFLIGDSNSRLPIDKDTLKSSYLKDMIDQITRLPVGDGIRNIGNALVDAGGENPAILGYTDPSDEDAATIRPRLQFAVSTGKFEGELWIEYNRGMDYYDLILVKDGANPHHVDNVDFSSMGEQIVNLVDDGEWRFAKVETLKAAPKMKLAA